MPPSTELDENVLCLTSTSTMSLCFVTDQKGPTGAFPAIMHGGVPAEAVEIGTLDVLLIQFGITDVDLIEREFLGKLCVIDDD
jgi:hypothetical protein